MVDDELEETRGELQATPSGLPGSQWLILRSSTLCRVVEGYIGSVRRKVSIF